MKTVIKRFVAFAIVAVLLVSCSTTEVVQPFDGGGRVWPEAPSQARIEFVKEFSSLSDLGIRPSLWNRIVNVTAGQRGDGMARPMAVATNSDGSVVFVADPDARCVHRYDLLGRRYRCLTTGEAEIQVAPVGLTVTEDGWLFVSDSQSGRILKAGPDSKYLEQFNAASILSQPTGIHWDDDAALLYVTDTKRQSVLVFDREGNLKREIGERGNLAGQFNFPTYLWMETSEELLVTDSLNFRMQRFGSDGSFVATFGKNGDLPGDLARPKGVATDSYGHIYVVDALMHLVQVFDRNGKLLLHFGERGRGVGQFWLPNGIFISKDDLIFVADSYNKRVQVFRYVGLES